MKTLVFAMILLGFTSGAFANPRNKKQSKANPQVTATVEQQLASHLTYPDALRELKGNGVVVIQFRLNENDRVTDLTVHSADQALNRELTNQLKHIKLTANAKATADKVYTAQLRFQAGE
jgi:Gram-negative bacterial TonB protein C-terminal